MTTTPRCDAIVIGAGFAGMYQLHRLRDELGLSVKVFERGSDVGGTWYWNRYPGARCDVESLFYCYSFSEELQQEWEWTERYPSQPEILRYADHVADKFDLRKDIKFNTSVSTAAFDATDNTWTVTLDNGSQASAPFLITAVGCLSASQIPDFPGLENFTGPTYHTGRWPHEVIDFTGKRVAVIGTGSSGIQVIPKIAEEATHLTVFQRTPNFSVPAHNRPLSADEQLEVKSHYADLRANARLSPSGSLFDPPAGNALELDEDQQVAALEKSWAYGGPGFMSTFMDTMVDEAANQISAEFVRARIRSIVKDQGVADLLSPTTYPIGSKRICVDTDYYETFNRANVDLISVADTPIDEITATGVRVDGTTCEVDAIVFATGYDAITGPLNAIDIRGLDGVALRAEWAHGPKTYLGIASAGFPNLFMITGPGSPSVLGNVIVAIEQHVDWVTDLIANAREAGIVRVEAEREAQDSWVEHVNEVASYTLFPRAASWYVGANIPGKPRVFIPYLSGYGAYRELCDNIATDGYRGFALTPAGALQPA
jgi:cyclohexanone monooxygenase